MSAPTVHLAGHDFDPNLPLSLQAVSLEAEIAACHVFQRAARRDLAAGDLRALSRLHVLNAHKEQLRQALAEIEQGC